ncbi:hypothetical protein N7471_013881 [Penicillium samsonianum]|uniref:uncharacterized protein n=1 Tax=Penicillium samsonianum TaxID=1882272 RepID=UPI002549905E|nr:uncharacterized protein N7471_013881 [Penicillium samsonianum]KAJ6118414.1 hypothetical protein N7471_013881 [Penicillium samsonianum]
MSGRAETRTPEPPDRNEHENSPPRLLRPRRSTRPPNNYAQDQELDIEQSNARSQRKKKTQGKPVAQREVITSESSTESEDPNASELLKELVKLRKETRPRDELHKEELQKVKEEFTAALAEWYEAAVRNQARVPFDSRIASQSIIINPSQRQASSASRRLPAESDNNDRSPPHGLRQGPPVPLSTGPEPVQFSVLEDAHQSFLRQI